MEELEGAVISPDPLAVSLSWDAFCNLLDGRPYHLHKPGSSEVASISSLESSLLHEQPGKPGPYFFPSHSSHHPLERFWLKVCLMESLCRQVAVVHRRTQRPLLCLDSKQICIGFPSDYEGYLPTLWSGAITLPDPVDSGGSFVEGMPIEMADMVSRSPTDTDPTYLSSQFREWPAGREVCGTALVESVDPIPGDEENGVQGLIRVHFFADSIAAEDFSGHDVFGLVIPLSSGTIRLWTRKVDSPERGIVLSGVTAMLSGQAMQSLQQECHQVISRTVASIYRSYPPESDIYSLGMLWLRALLGSDPTRWNRVLGLLPSLLTSLPPAVEGIDLCDFYTVHTRVREYLQDRDNAFMNLDIHGDLWWDGLVIALRAVSRISCFGYESLAAHSGTHSCESPAKLIHGDVAQLGRRAKIELFESDERDAAIVAACDSALHQLGMA